MRVPRARLGGGIIRGATRGVKEIAVLGSGSVSDYPTNQDLAVTPHKSFKWAINSTVVRIIAIFNNCQGRPPFMGLILK